MENGYLAIGKWDGVPVRVHWTAPVGIIVFTGFRFSPVAWIAFAFVIFVHEVGHAVIVRRCRASVSSIDLTGVGGECHWMGNVTPLQRALIAWGGVLAQLLLFAVIWVGVASLGPPDTPPLRDMLYVFTATNLILVAFNLIPIPPLDGVQAWRLPHMLVPILRRHLWNARRAVETRIAVRRLDEIDKRVDAGDVAPEINEQLNRILAKGSETSSTEAEPSAALDPGHEAVRKPGTSDQSSGPGK